MLAGDDWAEIRWLHRSEQMPNKVGLGARSLQVMTARLCGDQDVGTAVALSALARATDGFLRLLCRALAPHVVCSVPSATDAFALTFDDGPHPDTTPGLLDVLERHGATATFFLIGERAQAHPELVASIAARGHELGNHLMRDEPSIYLSTNDFRRQLSEVTAMLESYGRVRWFRPGSGWFRPRMLGSAADLGLGCALGTVVVDHVRSIDPRRLEQRLILRIRAGSLAVLHEGHPDRRGVVASTDAVLAALRRQGLRAVSLTRAVCDP